MFGIVHFLKDDEQLLIESFTQRWVVNGPRTVWTNPTWRVKKRKGITLDPTQYVRIRNKLTGDLRNVVGPQMVMLTENEEVIERLKGITLTNTEYVRLVDRKTGVIRVERGETIVYLAPTEETLEEEVQEGINIDENMAVLVRDTETGSLSLITKHQVFIPTPRQEIVSSQKRIRLEDHQVMVIKDRMGNYLIRRGTDDERAFFIQPYTEQVAFFWSSGIHKDKRTLKIFEIDLRPKFMWYEFEARTKDNVELVINITFFWQIADVEKMIHTTDDAPGDICSHARSSIIQAVSQVTLEAFLADFNTIVSQAVLARNDTFYTDRGIELLAVEVRSVACKDEYTQRILLEIIQETTNRINRLQKQQSENEIKIERLQGDIEAEEVERQLVNLRSERLRAEGRVEGESEADRVLAFFQGLGDDLSTAQKVELFNTLRKKEMMDQVSKGNATLFFTPNDVDLTIRT